MLDAFFLTVNEWMTGAPAIAAAGSFLWGMISVLFSPCHLASIPLIVAYVAGQERALAPRQAGFYSILFSCGLFLSIATVGILCAVLGRMLGDVGPYWQLAVGLVLIWVALGMFGVEACSVSGGYLQRFRWRGGSGAFFLGLAYGILSGSCTFGFIAPILAVIAIQKEIFTGVILILLFALGHCVPIVIAGSSTAFVRGLLESRTWQQSGAWFRRGAGVVIFALGVYFIANPILYMIQRGV